jgi:predicted permease
VSLHHDLRAAARSLRRRPALTATVTTALALGLAAAIALFAVVDVALYRPLAGRDSRSLVRLLVRYPTGDVTPSFSHPLLRHYREGSRQLAGLAAFSLGNAVDMSVAGQAPARVEAALVSGELFTVLGTTADRGRLLQPDDERQARAVVVLAHRLWQRAFGADPGVVGRTLRVNGHPFEVVGVAPPELVGPSFDYATDLWLPISATAQVSPAWAHTEPLDNPDVIWVGALGRLAAGASAASVTAELRPLTASWNAARPPDDAQPEALVTSANEARFHPDDRPRVARVSAALGAVVVLLLLLACVVAASLLLVHGARRERELAVRLALGAARLRLGRLLLAEAALLGVLALLMAVPLAVGMHRGLLRLMPADFPLATVTSVPLLSSRVLLFGGGAALLTVVLCGWAPALRAIRGSAAAPLLRAAGGPTVTARLPGGRAALVVQVALAMTVLATSGLLLRTVRALTAVDPGFRAEGAVVATVALANQGYDRVESGPRFLERLAAALSALPGVVSAGLGTHVPIHSSGMRATVQPVGYAPGSDEDLGVELAAVTPGFFAALGVPLVAGRPFAAGDGAGAPRVAIVNQAFVARFWPGRNGVGERIADVGPQSEEVEVVGVVADHRTRGLRTAPAPGLYLPLAQSYVPSVTMVVRGPAGEALLPTVRRAVATLDDDLPLYASGTLAARLRAATAQERALAVVVTASGAAALLLGLLGLSSALAFATEQRTRELGVRLALGAQRRQVGWLVLRQALEVLAGGVLLGSALALAAGRTVEGLLFGVGARDVPTLLAVAALLGGAGLLAAWLPARRAAALDPMRVLREG